MVFKLQFICIRKILTSRAQRWWSFWESLTLAMVKAVHPLVKAIYPLVEAAHPLVVGKNTERIVNAAGESTERTQISAHWAEPEVVGV